MRRPIGIWIAAIYLLCLVALDVLYLVVAIDVGSSHLLFAHTAAVLIALSGTILLVAFSRWAALLIAPQGPDTVTYVFTITYNFGPVILMAATTAALLYTAWLWRADVLR